MSLFWSLFGPEILYFGYGILYFGYGVLISLMESFIRNDRGIFVSFLVFFLSFLITENQTTTFFSIKQYVFHVFVDLLKTIWSMLRFYENPA